MLLVYRELHNDLHIDEVSKKEWGSFFNYLVEEILIQFYFTTLYVCEPLCKSLCTCSTIGDKKGIREQKIT